MNTTFKQNPYALSPLLAFISMFLKAKPRWWIGGCIFASLVLPPPLLLTSSWRLLPLFLLLLVEKGCLPTSPPPPPPPRGQRLLLLLLLFLVGKGCLPASPPPLLLVGCLDDSRFPSSSAPRQTMATSLSPPPLLVDDQQMESHHG